MAFASPAVVRPHVPAFALRAAALLALLGVLAADRMVSAGVMDLANRLARPSWIHLLGTDELGRDVLRISTVAAAYSARQAMVVWVICTALGVGLGWVTARRAGGALDAAVLLLAELLRGFPGLLFALLVASLGGGAVAALVATFWVPFWRLSRAEYAKELASAYVRAARATGRTESAIAIEHVLPNFVAATGPLFLAYLADVLGALVVVEFLGLGRGLGAPTLGYLLWSGAALGPLGWRHVSAAAAWIISLVYLVHALGGRGR